MVCFGELEEIMVSGLVILDIVKEKFQIGDVFVVGLGCRSEQSGDFVFMEVGVGDTVVYFKYGGIEITVEGEDLLIFNVRDVFVVVK